MPIETIHYLEMTDPDQLRPAQEPAELVDVRRVVEPYPELNRFLYTAVGGGWFWCDRLGWSYQDWLDFLARPGFETWIGYVRDTPAGYFELGTSESQGSAASQPDVQIESFGLMPAFIGRGIGGHFLSEAVRTAWARPTQRVWLHTCSNDHPNALANYQARGFRLYKTESEPKDLPATTPGPWPEWRR